MSVYKNGNKWMYDFWKNNVRQFKTGFNTKQEARDAEAEARKNLKNLNQSFTALCASRLKDVKERRTEKYFKETELLIKKLMLIWGNKKVITRQDVEDYLSSCNTKYIANKDLRFIKALFNHGVEREMLGANPAARIKFFAVKKEKKYIPKEADINKILSASTPKERSYFLALINTMARVGEINKLKWEDVQDEYLILRTRKSKNSNIMERTIPINNTLRKVLDSMPKYGEYVFCYKDGTPYLYRSKILKRACEKAGVKEIGYHALRHYGASKLADKGVPITVIQELLGHTTTTTTDIYLQSIKQSVKDAVKKLEPQ